MGNLQFSIRKNMNFLNLSVCFLTFVSLLFPTLRAAQKLSLPRRKKSQLDPCSQPAKGPSPPLLYTGGFSGALQLSPPAVPPCLLRAGSKVKDTPAMGKVR